MYKVVIKYDDYDITDNIIHATIVQSLINLTCVIIHVFFLRIYVRYSNTIKWTSAKGYSTYKTDGRKLYLHVSSAS